MNVFVAASVLAVGAFEMGRARASRSTPDRRRTPVVEAVRHAAPAVVSIYAQQRRRRNVLIRSAGSGVIVHPAGYVITNSHVIRGGSGVVVELWGDAGRYRAKVVANLPQNDLALLRIQRAQPFPYVSIASTRSVMLGEAAIAIGNPRGLGDTITVGVVSALGRDAKLAGGASLRNLIQTDASINNGNSGGALLNLDGELIGVIVSLMPSSDGIAFAIPGDQVKRLLHRALGGAPAAKPLPEQPKPKRPRVTSSIKKPASSGGKLPPPTVAGGRGSATKTAPLMAEDFGMSVRVADGYVQVTRVASGSAAQRAGILAGDILASIDGRKVRSDLDVILAFSATRPGRIYDLQLRRSGARRTASLVTPR
ncbi:MAG: trypsin-like peptidase domain-containing protein [Planctomycetota bacterium]|nr:trypsin-like peptidase domain-containing protein [Planctomycetota bacterium]